MGSMGPLRQRGLICRRKSSSSGRDCLPKQSATAALQAFVLLTCLLELSEDSGLLMQKGTSRLQQAWHPH